MGPVNVTVKSDVMESKYQGKPPYVVLVIDGAERNYTLDSDACASFFEGQKGNTFALEAVGGKGQEEINYLGDDAPAPQQAPPPSRPASAPRQQQAPPPQRQAPAPQQQAPRQNAAPANRPTAAAPLVTPDKALGKVKVMAAKFLTMQKVCLAATESLALEWKMKHGKDMPLEMFQSLNASNFIAVSRALPVDALPVSLDYGSLGKREQEPVRQEPAQAAPSPEPEPEPEPEPVDDSQVPF